MLIKCNTHVKVRPIAHILKVPALKSPRQMELGTVTAPQLSSDNVYKTITILIRSENHVKMGPIASILKVPALKSPTQNATRAL
jgi:hypothetical protein